MNPWLALALLIMIVGGVVYGVAWYLDGKDDLRS